ncbi:MAG: 4-hydroxy-tetrahydrodipicolinate reductase [Suipraeoptans sp.]
MKVIITAPRGKMGKFITKSAIEIEGLEPIGAVAPKGRNYIGNDLGEVAMTGTRLDVPVSDDLESIIENCDVIIDFSTKEYSLYVLELAKKYRKALVCGTTGFNDEEKELFCTAANVIPVLYAANTSKLVNIMNKLLEIVASTLDDDADIEIVEMHDNKKLDAPSGTSKEMGEIIAHARNTTLDEVARYGRHGAGKREPGTIGYHSLRAGNISSSHSVVFGCMGERLEITHHSYSFECFARGACECALFLKDKKPGYYTIKDALDL